MSVRVQKRTSLAATAAAVACCLAVLQGTHSTRVGDRHHGNTESGLFYFFGPEITIVDPATGEIVNTLEGAESWGDTVYMRDHAQIHHYVFANDRQDQRLWVIDVDEEQILSKVDTGDSPVHLYAIPSREEVWTHPDTNGTFDILHLGDLNYLAHSNLQAHMDTPGHGKLLWDPNLQDTAFATNTNEPYIYQIDLEEREKEYDIEMTLESAPYECNRTHGIGYSYVNDHLYVECSHPDICGVLAEEDASVYQDGTICSGSAWEVDVETRKPVARIVSPALNEAYGDSFGAQGQIYVTPDERFAVVANKYQNYVHFLKPVSGGDTLIIDLPVENTPGKVEFWPKDNVDTWGPDSVVSDYWAIIAQEAEEDGAGVVMIDLGLVLEAFEAGDSGEDIAIVQIAVGPGSMYRPVARGSHYAATPIRGEDSYTSVAIIDLETQEVIHELDIASVGRIQWVPDHNDEVVADHEIRIAALEETNQILAEAAAASGDTQTVETMAEAALALGVIGFVGALVAVAIGVRNARHAKAVSGGQFKPFHCV